MTLQRKKRRLRGGSPRSRHRVPGGGSAPDHGVQTASIPFEMLKGAGVQ